MKKTEIWCATDRQTDGQKKDILASPKNGKKRTGKSKLHKIMNYTEYKFPLILGAQLVC